MLTDKNLATLLVGGILAVGLLALLGPWWPMRDLFAVYTPEAIGMLRIEDSTAQRGAHQLTLAMLALAALAGLWLRFRRPQWLRGSAATAIALRLHRITRPGPLCFILTTVAILSLSRSRSALAYGLLLIPISLLARYVRPAILNRAGWVALLIYLPLLMLPGFFLGYAVWQADPIWLEMHYVSSAGVGEQLAAGMQLYGEIRHHYGLLLSATFGVIERHVGALNAGQYYRAIQVLNVVFALLAVLAYWRWRPGNAVKVLAPIMLVLPFVHSLHLSLVFPNQSAWRFIGLPVAVLLLLTLGRAGSERLPLLLGGIAGLALLFNLETGIALSCGLVVFLIARVGPAPIGTWLARAVGFIFGSAAVVLVVLLIARVGLGAWPIPISLPKLFEPIFAFSAGFGGARLKGEPLALLIFLHSLYLVTYAALRWRFGALSFAGAFRAAIATTLLVWFAYYANRPIFWNLWSSLFLYGFLLADFFDWRLLRWNGTSVRRLRISAAVIVVALVIIPAGAKLNLEAATTHALAVRFAVQCSRLDPQPGKQGCLPGNAEPVLLLSGIPVRKDLAELIKEKADYLQLQPDKSELVYFTANSYFIPRLTGLYERRLDYRDAFAETITNRQFDELAANLLALAPPRILFDAPSSLVFRDFETQFHRRFYERLRGRLEAAYRPAGIEHGWLVLVPIAHSAQ